MKLYPSLCKQLVAGENRSYNSNKIKLPAPLKLTNWHVILCCFSLYKNSKWQVVVLQGFMHWRGMEQGKLFPVDSLTS